MSQQILATSAALADGVIKVLWIGTNSNADVDPEYARWDLTQASLNRLLAVRSVVAANNLSEGRYWSSPSSWGAENVAEGEDEGDDEDEDEAQEELRTELDEMIVTDDSFWFTCVQRHTDDRIETQSVMFTELEMALADPGAHAFLGDVDAEQLKGIIRDAGDTDLPDDV